jgi:hypothetical protein
LLTTLETGIKSETICAKMRPLFKKHDVTDEELIKGVGDSMSEETERLNKLALSSRKQAAKVNSCMYDEDGQESKASRNVQSGEKGKRGTLMMTLEAVKTDVANIKSSMVENNRNDGKQRPACPKCKLQGNVPIVIYVVRMNTIQEDANSDWETGEDSVRGTGSSPR